jgi:hypothetical protein
VSAPPSSSARSRLVWAVVTAVSAWGCRARSAALVHQLPRALCGCGSRYGAVMVDESAAETEQQDGTIHVALDESFNPLICVGATVAETEFTTVNTSISQLYTELTSHSWMADLESFQNFTKDGFHLSNDSMEISNRFVSFLAHTIGFNSFIYFSENSKVSKNKTTLLLYRELIRTVLQKYRSRPLIKLYFEQNQELDRYFARLVAHSLKSVRRPKPEIQVLVRPKMDPPLLSVCDYTMLTFARWYKGYYGCGPKVSRVQTSLGGILTHSGVPFR